MSELLTYAASVLAIKLPAWIFAPIVTFFILLVHLRKNQFESPKLKLLSATGDKQAQHFRDKSLSTIVWSVVNVQIQNNGNYPISILDYRVNVYETLFGYIFRRRTRSVEGNGFFLDTRHGKLVSCSRNGRHPVPIGSFETKQLSIHDKGIWPDRRWRIVELEIKYSPNTLFSGKLKSKIRPSEHSYTDKPSPIAENILDAAFALKAARRAS